MAENRVIGFFPAVALALISDLNLDIVNIVPMCKTLIS